jgi:hypothetical protein
MHVLADGNMMESQKTYQILIYCMHLVHPFPKWACGEKLASSTPEINNSST